MSSDYLDEVFRHAGNPLYGDHSRVVVMADITKVRNALAPARNRRAPEPALESMNFTIEMETGTGKTYVYLRTIYELYQLYGFTKFMVVVPSVAIDRKSTRLNSSHLGISYAVF